MSIVIYPVFKCDQSPRTVVFDLTIIEYMYVCREDIPCGGDNIDVFSYQTVKLMCSHAILYKLSSSG